MKVSAGELSIIWPWQKHGGKIAPLPPADFYWLVLPLKGVTNQPVKPDTLNFSFRTPHQSGRLLLQRLHTLDHQVIKTKKSFGGKFINLVKHLHSSHGQTDITALGWLYLMIAELDATIQQKEMAHSVSPAIMRVETFLNEELPHSLEKEWNLDGMASACRLGRTVFTDCVKQLFGDTPKRVLSKMRIEKAKELLTQNPSSITEVAFECGFSCSQRFATVFKQFQGMTPSDYMKCHHTQVQE